MWVSVNTTMEPAIWSDIMSNIFDAHDDKIKPKKRRNINTIKRVVKLLQDECEMNTIEIHQALHRTWPRWCPGMTRLGNILSRNKEFVKIGSEKVSSGVSGHYDIMVWGLANEAGLNN